ncbi:MAG: sulfite exporter TauE/SafE family protein [Clostridia bacterium]|nr:sulfite exporter TauE/SafE family protein [Clostridia bacterium]
MWILVSFFISALMGMGVGGGGLFVIYLTLCMNFPQILAQGTNLCFFVIAGSGSLIYHLKKRKIKLWHALSLILFGAIGSLAASHFLSFIDPKYPRIALGALLIISGSITIYNALIKRIVKKFKKTLYK